MTLAAQEYSTAGLFAVLDPGPFTTVQDSGRYGHQRYGIPVCGALDKFAYRVANMLVGNPETAAVLETTFAGPKMQALRDTVVAVTGANVPVLVNDRPRARWAAFPLEKGDVVAVKLASAGVRAYLAVAGGFMVPDVMGSRSTYAAGALGGLEGRPVRKGDILPGRGGFAGCSAGLPRDLWPVLRDRITLRVILGPQDDWFDEGLDCFFGSEYTVSPRSDRVGYRFEGPAIKLRAGVPVSIISEPNVPGAVQVPHDGKPIIVLREQTSSGYAKIATVISPDLDLVAQARPGDRVRFMPVNLEQARRCREEYHARLKHIKVLLQSPMPLI